jgi:hypothetical protein
LEAWAWGCSFVSTTGDSAPYKRIVVLHIAIIIGGIGVMALGQPLTMLVVLVLLKLGVDVVLHLREHRSAVGPGVASAG